MNEQKRIEELKKREAELSGELRSLNKLHRLSAALLRPADLNTALNVILDGSMEIVGTAMGNVQMYDPARKSLKIVVQRGFDQEFLDYFREVSVDDDTACARAMAARDKLIIEDIEREYDAALRVRLLLYHYGSAADGAALAARGYRVAAAGQRVALEAPLPPHADAG